jgi:hypothetical protein
MYLWRNEYWFYFIPSAYLAGFAIPNREASRITLFSLLTVLPYFLIISTAQTKLEWYDIPLYPFLSLQIGLVLYYVWKWVRQFVKDKSLQLAIGISAFLLVFFFPFRQCWNFIHHFGEKPWDDAPHRQGYYLQNAIKKRQNLDGYHFSYSDYHGQIKFYIEVLRHQGVKVDFNHNFNYVQPGQKVVISQKPMEDTLLKQFSVQKLEQAFGCTVYLVQQRL